ncbi:hypothetical protein [Paenibacillus aestuarii]|uniref:Uncharacterized protein n=1 Tax=Paenibacillus aestuarii TaxID=516965 RepID=A0ABW0K3H0_9BACL|nr:hypothetical protein [Paenibacillus aestuarii]
MTNTTTPNEVETLFIRQYIMLPFLTTMVEKSIRDIKADPTGVLDELFIRTSQHIINEIQADLTEVRKALRSLNIRVWDDPKNDGALHYRYLCRGREYELAIPRVIARTELSELLGKYTHRAEKALSQR